MNVMQIAFTKAVVVKMGKSISKSGKQIGMAFKSVYARLNDGN